MSKEHPVIWLQGAGCTGCSLSVINAVSPSIKNLLIDEIVPGEHINLVFHPTLMAGSGEAVIEVLQDIPRRRKGEYLLVLEGAIPTREEGVYALVGEMEGKEITLMEKFLDLAKDALAIIALGTCSSFGGIPSGQPNPTGCKGAGEVLEEEGIKKPLVTIPGCPPHPDWFTGTVFALLVQGLPKPQEVDELNRLKAFYGALIHENCPRRAYFEEGKFAKNLSEEGCLYELGCKGPFTNADCPLRHWNGGVNWVIGVGSPCLSCTEPQFPDLSGPFYRKISDMEQLKIKIGRGGEKR